jgi:hypothetical protein
MKLIFETKEQSNQRRLEAFLALSPTERFYAFLRISRAYAKLYNFERKERKTNNFIVEKK